MVGFGVLVFGKEWCCWSGLARCSVELGVGQCARSLDLFTPLILLCPCTCTAVWLLAEQLAAKLAPLPHNEMCDDAVLVCVWQERDECRGIDNV